jgi:hypothetical protein
MVVCEIQLVCEALRLLKLSGSRIPLIAEREMANGTPLYQ